MYQQQWSAYDSVCTPAVRVNAAYSYTRGTIGTAAVVGIQDVCSIDGLTSKTTRPAAARPRPSLCRAFVSMRDQAPPLVETAAVNDVIRRDQ